MKQYSTFLFLPTMIVLALSACATQAPAPVVDANHTDTTVYSPPSNNTSNPYGATPYQPDNTSHTATPHTTNYTGNYAPVDTTQTHHRVVAGDTIYNISKRYGISQNDLRTWNGLSDNNISIGQTLLVKPQQSNPSTTTNIQSQSTNQTIIHQVVAGDTIYNIAKRYGISQQDLRTQNHLQSDHIQIGQTLKIHQNNTHITQQPTPSTPTPTVTPSQTTTLSAPTTTVNGITWQSPLPNGKVSEKFTTANRSIKLSGSKGQAVTAAADGQVIFSGAGPRGYGKLIVIQHSSQYLTAYGHNETLDVAELQQVKRGQKIGTVGSSGVVLFEVRENSKPVDPSKLIKF